MFRKLINTWNKPGTISVINRLSHIENNLVEQKPADNFQILDTKALPNDDFIDIKNEEISVLEECHEDISHVAPYLRPTFNFAAYVNRSETLQKLVHLGVNLHKLEKNLEVPPYLLKLDFERNIKNHIMFLHDLGLQTEDLGEFITKNPFVFKEDLDNLHVRVNYLKSKKFDDSMVLQIVQANPLWLNYSTQEIDNCLGFFQKTFTLTGNEVRLLAVKRPKLITYDKKHVKLNIFVISEEMGFSPEETKKILLTTPALFTKNQNFILKTFEYIHKNMNISLETIVKMPNVLTCREFRVKQRHLFLEKLGKVQFDPKKPNYISVSTIVSGSDADFATEVAGSSIQAFNAFLKSL